MILSFVVVGLVLLLLVVGWFLVRANLRVPSRRYEGPASVANVYDNWTNTKVMEHYWGEHLHAGYYGNPPVKKDFIQAKVDFIDEMIAWGVAQTNPTLMQRLEKPEQFPAGEPVRILDVGCGMGGSVRHLARRWPKTSHVTGVTISPAQTERAAVLARLQKVDNGIVMDCDALKMGFNDNSFDIVYTIEAEMHMPDKQRFVSEMARVLKPGGILILACWNVRDTRDAPLSKDEAAHVRLLVEEWCHAEFTSIPDYIDILKANGLTAITAEDWAAQTQPSWRQAVKVSASNPAGMINVTMQQRWNLVRDAYTIMRYDEAFRKGLCQYGLIRAQKAG